MKFNFDGMVVEIKAKKPNGKYNTSDAEYIANSISIYAGEAAHRYESLGLEALARQARSIANSIYNTLDATGAYQD